MLRTTFSTRLQAALLGLVIVGTLLTGGAFAGLTGGAPGQARAAAALAVDAATGAEAAEAAGCYSTYDRHYGAYVCIDYAARAIGNGWYRGWVMSLYTGRWVWADFYLYSNGWVWLR
jgi:hypothetical protein